MQVIVLSEFGPPGVLLPATADDPVPGPARVIGQWFPLADAAAAHAAIESRSTIGKTLLAVTR